MGEARVSEAMQSHPDQRYCRRRCQPSRPRRSSPPLPLPPASRKGTANAKPQPRLSTPPTPPPLLFHSLSCAPCCLRRRRPGGPRRWRRGEVGRKGRPGGLAVAAHWYHRCRRGGSLAGSREPRRGSGRTYAAVRFAASPPTAVRRCRSVGGSGILFQRFQWFQRTTFFFRLFVF